MAAAEGEGPEGPQRQVPRRRVTGEQLPKQPEPKKLGFFARRKEKSELKDSLPERMRVMSPSGQMMTINFRKGVLKAFPLKSSDVIQRADTLFGRPTEEEARTPERDRVLLELLWIAERSIANEVYQDLFRRDIAKPLIEELGALKTRKDKNFQLSEPHALLAALRVKGDELVTTTKEGKEVTADRDRFFARGEGALGLLRRVRRVTRGTLKRNEQVNDETMRSMIERYDVKHLI